MANKCCEICRGLMGMNRDCCLCGDCHCHTPTPQEEWETEFEKIVEGRKLSKYHKNYIATHIVRAFIEKALSTQRQQMIEDTTRALKATWNEVKDKTTTEIVRGSSFLSDDEKIDVEDAFILHWIRAALDEVIRKWSNK